jgi:hypothetical protein
MTLSQVLVRRSIAVRSSSQRTSTAYRTVLLSSGTLPIPGTPGIPERAIPFYSVHAVGVQANFILPAKNLSAFFKYYDEYRALARPEGRTIDFGFSWTLQIPKPAPPAPPAAKP